MGVKLHFISNNVKGLQNSLNNKVDVLDKKKR